MIREKVPKISFTGKEEAVMDLLLREGTPCIICYGISDGNNEKE